MVILNYFGEKYYKMEFVVSDENLVMVLGIVLLEFMF